MEPSQTVTPPCLPEEKTIAFHSITSMLRALHSSPFYRPPSNSTTVKPANSLTSHKKESLKVLNALAAVLVRTKEVVEESSLKSISLSVSVSEDAVAPDTNSTVAPNNNRPSKVIHYVTTRNAANVPPPKPARPAQKPIPGMFKVSLSMLAPSSSF